MITDDHEHAPPGSQKISLNSQRLSLGKSLKHPKALDKPRGKTES